MSEYTRHTTVLLDEVVDHFIEASKDDKEPLFGDLTFGGGGHTFRTIEKISHSKVVCTDQDPDALKNGQNKIDEKGLQERVQLISGNFEGFKSYLDQVTITKQKEFNGFVIDLGVSSHHFDDFSRGFSFREDAPLDMRMNYKDDSIKTAAQILKDYSEQELVNIFQDFGEEKFSKRIAQRIVKDRQEKPITRTKELEDICKACYPANLRYGKINPATKIFQALRIEVNRELEVVDTVLDDLVQLLKVGGRLCVISFHSLEDRIVKHKFKEYSKREDLFFNILTKKPIAPTENEILHNSRSRSAKLRVIERVSQKKSKNKYAKIKE